MSRPAEPSPKTVRHDAVVDGKEIVAPHLSNRFARWHTIPADKIKEAHRLLMKGQLSPKEIASQTGISLSIIYREKAKLQTKK